MLENWMLSFHDSTPTHTHHPCHLRDMYARHKNLQGVFSQLVCQANGDLCQFTIVTYINSSLKRKWRTWQLHHSNFPNVNILIQQISLSVENKLILWTFKRSLSESDELSWNQTTFARSRHISQWNRMESSDMGLIRELIGFDTALWRPSENMALVWNPRDTPLLQNFDENGGIPWFRGKGGKFELLCHAHCHTRRSPSSFEPSCKIVGADLRVLCKTSINRNNIWNNTCKKKGECETTMDATKTYKIVVFRLVYTEIVLDGHKNWCFAFNLCKIVRTNVKHER